MTELSYRDLQSIQQARDLAERAHQAALTLRNFTQADVDRIARNMVEAGLTEAERLAKMAVEETGFGKWEDKLFKNQFATRSLWEYIKDMKTVGFLDDEGTVRRIAEPVGVVAAVVPSTNPTSTALNKAIISLKARNAVVLSPHPAAVRCISETAEIMKRAAVEAGAPEDAVCWMTVPELPGTHELMSHPKVGVILATGGTGLVKAAYSAGKPAYGVGPGNVPAFIERTADPEKAVKDIILSKCFDNGTVCASEQSIIVDCPLDETVRKLLKQHRSYFCTQEEIRKLEAVMILPERGINPKIVGQSSFKIAHMAGFTVPEDTTMLVVEIEGVGSEYPLSVEKLSPVICYFTVDGWEEGCELSIKIIYHGGLGHTMTLHTNDTQILERFALEKPVMRVLVNTPATHGAIGYSTDLPPSMTLGCGTWGGSITADNVTPMHLLNIKRLAYETKSINAGKTTITAGSSETRWRYDDQYRYRPVSEAPPVESDANQIGMKRKTPSDDKPDSQVKRAVPPETTYGEGITEARVDEIIREFKARS
ncbi:MAG: aldehyde dehydrogenase family protein [candidate division Zixibacteria bacterium]|nr:aldehyde dehydrogenase family protein [Candidatus Tariuqbacter arcticus]